ncbi:MAG: TRAP transporter small permease subunit [Tepidamorphaceae bacterium]|nr:TRAP transporter small permease subunit [Rhodobiaceae bacterium]MCC0049870.1 TRAP transporter small permease subunit [Rhodobiaceae bacterium]
MSAALDRIDKFNRLLGRVAAWAALLMMLFQGVAVLLRYVFSYGLISFQEAVIYGHACLFMLGAAYVLQVNGHVRVDVFYNRMKPSARRAVDIAALVVFVIPVACAIGWYSFPYVLSAWSTLEGSRQTGGIPAVFLLKTSIMVFALSLALQAAVIAVRFVTGQPMRDWEPEPVSADNGDA